MKFVRVCTFVSKNFWSHLFPTVFLRSYFVGEGGSQFLGSKPERTGLLWKTVPARPGLNGQLLSRWLIFYLGKVTGADAEICLWHSRSWNNQDIEWTVGSQICCFKLHRNSYAKLWTGSLFSLSIDRRMGGEGRYAIWRGSRQWQYFD